MSREFRPHLMGVDDGAFDKRRDRDVPLVAVTMEAHDLVEAVAMTRFAVDGDDVTGFLGRWIAGLRVAPALHGVLFGGITIAGLGVVDIESLAEQLGMAVLVANRQRPRNATLESALEAAGLRERIEIVRRTPAAWRHDDGLVVSHAGIDQPSARQLIDASRGKSRFPEPLRLAHLIGGAVSAGESRGRP